MLSGGGVFFLFLSHCMKVWRVCPIQFLYSLTTIELRIQHGYLMKGETPLSNSNWEYGIPTVTAKDYEGIVYG